MNPLLARHRADIVRLAQRHDVGRVRVFGSRGRGTARSSSDLDLLLDPPHPRPAFFPGGLVADLEALLSCRVDVVTEAGLQEPLRSKILDEARPL